MLFTDQLNNSILLKSYPKRIVSLVPSQTELLWDFGLREEIVGATKFCIHPQQLYNSVTKIGGTKTIDIQKIRDLNPDVIIGNKEENDHQQILELKNEFPVWMSDIYNLNDSLEMIKKIGSLVNKQTKALEIATDIENSFLNLHQHKASVLYLIWKNPFMAAGNHTFIGNMLYKMGLANCITDELARYPSLSMDDIKKLNPEYVFLSTEPYPFNEKAILDFEEVLPKCKIKLVDGELFSWYGSRLLKSATYFNNLI